MAWWVLPAMWISSFVLTALLAPGPNKDLADNDKFKEFGIPSTKSGVPVKLLWGTVRVSEPNIVFWGGLDADPIIQHIPGGFLSGISFGLLGGEDVTIGYRYMMTVQMVLGIPFGSDCKLKGIWIDDRNVFDGSSSPVGYVSSGNYVALSDDYFFGGPASGGGIEGWVQFFGGTFTQTAPQWMTDLFTSEASLDPTLAPGYKGMSYVLFRGNATSNGFYIGNGSRMFSPSFEVRAIPGTVAADTPLGLGAIGDDANPAEVLYDVLTSGWGKGGVPTAQIDSASFTTAGTTLATEGNGISFQTSGEMSVENIVELVLKQIDGVIYEDPATGAMSLQLVREDYTVSALPLFDPSNVERIESYAVSTFDSTFNEVRVVYPDRSMGYTQRTAVAQDGANIIASLGKKRTSTLRYPGCKTATLASKLASRDLRTLSLPLAKMRIKVNRDAATLRPGDPFRFTWSEFNSTVDKVFRLQAYDLGSLGDNTVVMECVEDQFAADFNVFDPPDFPDSIIPTVGPITASAIFEAPRWINSRQFANPDAGHAFYLAAKPAGGTNANFEAQLSSDGTTFNTDKGLVPYAQSAQVSTAVSWDTDPYDVTTGIVIKNVSNTSVLQTATETEIRQEGKNMFLIGSEILFYENYTDLGSGVYRLNNVWRESFGTRQADHAVDDVVWFPLSAGIQALSAATLGLSSASVLSVKYVPKNAWGGGTDTDIANLSITPGDRAGRPASVQSLRVAGSRSADIVENRTVWSWLRRKVDVETINRPDDADDAETGTVFDARGRVVGDGAFSDPNSSWVELSADISATTSTMSMDKLGSGDVELDLRSQQTFLALGEQYGWENPTLYRHLARYRQLLINQNFKGLGDWTITGTPVNTEAGPSGETGLALGGTGSSSTWTASQKVSVAAMSPDGLHAYLRGYRTSHDVNDTLDVQVRALDVSDATLATSSTGAVVPSTASKWDVFDLELTLPTDTAKIEVFVSAVAVGDTDANVVLAELDLRIGQFGETALGAPDLILNGGFDGSLSSWTTSSGTWAASSDTNSLAGGGGLEPSTGSGNTEIYQEIVLPSEFKERGTVHVQFWRRSYGADTGKVVLESRTSAGAVVSSTETVDSLSTDGYWHKEDLFLDLEDTVDKVRVRVVAVSAVTSGLMRFDEFRLFAHAEILPTEQHDEVTFDTQPDQTLPITAAGWADLGLPAPARVYPFTEAASPLLDAMDEVTPEQTKLTAINSPRLGETFAGWKESGSYVGKSCVETSATAAMGLQFEETTEMDFGSTSPWTVLIPFKIFSGAFTAVAGSKTSASLNQGWSVQLNGTGTLTLKIADGSSNSQATLDTSDGNMRGSRRYMCISWDGVSTAKFFSDTSVEKTLSTALLGTISNTIRPVIGAAATDTSADAQYAGLVIWNSVVPKTDIDKWWKVGAAPDSNVSYTVGGLAAASVGSDADGDIVVVNADSQLALVEDAALVTDTRGVSVHASYDNLVEPDVNDSTWTARGTAPTKTTRFGTDAQRGTRSVRIVGTSTGWLASELVTAAAGDVTVVFWAKGDAARTCKVDILTSADAVDDTWTYSLTTTWKRFEHTFSWSGATADFRVGFAPSNDGTSRTMELSAPVGVFYATAGNGSIPYVVPATKGVLLAASLTYGPPQDSQYTVTGEMAARCVLKANPLTEVSVLEHESVSDGDLDKRSLSIDSSRSLVFYHYDGSGGNVNATFTVTDVSTEWLARARWSRRGILESAASFTNVVDGSSSPGLGRTSAWTDSGTVLDPLNIGNSSPSGSAFDTLDGLVSYVRITAREKAL